MLTTILTLVMVAVAVKVLKGAVAVVADAEKANEPKPTAKKYTRYHW
jgi:hypothetical protein